MPHHSLDIPACSHLSWKRLVKLSQAQWRPARGGKGEGRRPPPEKDQMRWPEKFWDLSGGLTNTRGMCWDMMHNPHQSTSININQHQLASIRSEPTFSWEKMLKITTALDPMQFLLRLVPCCRERIGFGDGGSCSYELHNVKDRQFLDFMTQ